jgi:hypothetical protein
MLHLYYVGFIRQLILKFLDLMSTSLGFGLKEVFDANLYSMESKKNTYDEKFEVFSHPISRSENYKLYLS